MRQSNVLPFPTENASGKQYKLFAVLFYLALAWMLADPRPLVQMSLVLSGQGQLLGIPGSLNEGGLGLIITLGMIYALGVRHRARFVSFVKGRKLALVLIAFLVLFSVWPYLPILIGLTLAYWLLIGRSGRDIPYFLRFHLLTALVLNGFIALPTYMLQAIVEWMGALLRLFQADFALPFFSWYSALWPYLVILLFWVPAIWLAFAVIMGRTPYISQVTPNVRAWT